MQRLIRALRSETILHAHVRLPAGRRGTLRRRDAASVSSAIDGLARKCAGAADRIAVIGEEGAADAAVSGAMTDWRVGSLVLLSPRLNAATKAALAQWREAPVFSIASSEDRAALRDAADVYLASGHPNSDVKVLERAGRGSRMF